MNFKKIIIISFIIMCLLMPVSFADDGDYTITSAIKDIMVNDDGSTFITEIITYDVEGSINGVYRDIPHSSYQNITDISVETPGFYNTVEVIKSTGRTRIKVWLYEDSAKTRRTYDAKVDVTYKYTFNKGVKIYNDIAELQYMTWGNEWDSGVDYLKSIIHIPGSNQDVEYWNNPESYVVSTNWTDSNTLTTVSKNINSHTSYEQRILMPKSFFKSYENAQVIDIDAKEKIEADQKKYLDDMNFKNTVLDILSGIIGILMFIPLAIYGLFGREPKISYMADYEYDLPTDATPIQVNSIVIGDVGVITDDGIYATIFDLINRGYLKVISSSENDTIIRQTSQDINNLKSFEKYLLSYLSKFAVNGDISMKSIGESEDPTMFKKFKDSWMSQASEEVPTSLIQKYFNDKGSKIYSRLSAIFLIMSVVLFIVASFVDLQNHEFILFGLSALLFVESLVIFFIPNTFAGRWTVEGKEFHDKWKNFEKYVKDFSLIKERPPASIQVWGKYLVYAAALGCADEASKNMKKYFDLGNVPEDYFADSNVVLFAYYGGYNHMDSSFSSLIQTDTDSSGIGSVGGGGFGGGGGGTF